MGIYAYTCTAGFDFSCVESCEEFGMKKRKELLSTKDRILNRFPTVSQLYHVADI